MLRVRWPLGFLAPLLFLSGCSREQSAVGPPLATWTVGPEPSASIGGNDPREEYALFEVTAATVLGDGRIVLATPARASWSSTRAAGST